LSFTLLALLAYLRAQREQRLSWVLVGALCYALATTTKEIYLPLPLILLLLASRDWRVRLPLLIPFVVVALAYVPLRFYMLGGGVLSSYAEDHTGWTEILQLPWIYAQYMGWTAPWQWGLATAGWLAVLALLWRAPRRLGWPLLVWTLVLWLPLLPILWRIPRYHSTYYLFLPALLTAVAWVWMLGEWMLRYPRWGQALGGLGFALLLAANFSALAQEQKRLAGDLDSYREQGQFLIYHRSQTPEVLVYRVFMSGFLLFMRDALLPERGIQTGNLGHCAEVDCLCQLTYAGQTAWFYQKGTWQHQQLPVQAPAHCSMPEPLSLDLRLTQPDTLAWTFGPYPQDAGGFYTLLLTLDSKGNPTRQATQVDKLAVTGHYVFPKALTTPFEVVLRYTSPAGWETYSPRLRFNPAAEVPVLQWVRP